jgi:hypothetical protein
LVEIGVAAPELQPHSAGSELRKRAVVQLKQRVNVGKLIGRRHGRDELWRTLFRIRRENFEHPVFLNTHDVVIVGEGRCSSQAE